jgi:tetratricopeptide (TPR) repeat protein
MKSRLQLGFLGFILGSALAFPRLAPAAAAVKVYERDEVIPTYLSGPPEPNPMFYFGRESQGAEGRIYPYPLYDNLTNQRGEKSYHLVYLENEFVKIAIAPEIGGRLLSALDKTDNYDFIYRQHVIKPALIGLIGAWISGGIEWNIPHHHRATTFLPVQWRIEEGPGAAKTVWVGEMEIRDRMSWAVGYTLHPGSSVLTCSVRILNRTPLAHTMLCFANVAVSANENYQIIFPPRTQWVTYHGKREFASWPVAHSRYAGADFSSGVDVSWWKNHITANSMFAWNYQEDFFGGYDHGRNAGIVSVADHHVVPGKKFWTWGSGPRGRMWDDILTDTDGPYVELMTGAYSDNQPDYSWLQPFETRAFEMNWYPLCGIDGIKNANLDAAVNLVVTNGRVRVGFYTPAAHEQAFARVVAGGKVISEERISISPAHPYTKEIQLPAGVSEFEVRASLSAEGRELVAYSPVKLELEPHPHPVSNIPEPQEIQNNEELFLAGQRVDQFHDPRRDGEPYWRELLRHDPGNTAAHTSLGILDLERARFTDAEQHFRQALERLTARYTSPKDSEPQYYLGFALVVQGKADEAFDAFYKAAWSQEWKGPSYFSLAQIASSRGNFPAALEFANRSLDANALNVRAYGLKVAILRHLRRDAEAREILAAAIQKTDQLDLGLLAEKWLLARDKSCARELFGTLNEFPAAAQEVAAEFMDTGLWDDGREVLTHTVDAASDRSKVSPLVYYYLAHFAEKLGDAAKAAEFRRTAAQQPPDYAFPFQSEMVAVLRRAMEANPQDARAPYYLGNLLFDWQPEEAVALWEKSVSLAPNFSIAWRNLAQPFAHKSDDASRAKAIGYLEKAVALPDALSTQFAELDGLYAAAGAPVEKRLTLLKRNQKLVLQKDEGRARLIGLEVCSGEFDDAIALLQDRTFNVWEGATAYNTGELWAQAHLARGLKHFAVKDYRDALADFAVASKFPVNLRANEQGVASHQVELAWWTACAHEALGEMTRAREAWSQAATNSPAERRGPGRRGGNPLANRAQAYFQALALRKLGQNDRAEAALRDLVAAGEGALAATDESAEKQPGDGLSPRVRTATANYISGLGHAGLGETEKARANFNAALTAVPDHFGAKIALGQLSEL